MMKILLRLFGLPPYEFLYEQHYFHAPEGKLCLVQVDTCFSGSKEDIPNHYHPIKDFPFKGMSDKEIKGVMDDVIQRNAHREDFTLLQLVDDHGRVLVQ